MTARRLYVPAAQPSRDANGRALPAKLKFFEPTGTYDTLKAVYTDDTLGTPHSQPIPSDSQGRFPAIWGDSAQTWDVVYYDQTFGRQLGAWEGISPLSDAAAASVTFAEQAASEASDSATAAATSATTAQSFANQFGDLSTAVASAQTSANAAAASATAAATYDPTHVVHDTIAVTGAGLVTGGGALNASRTLTVTAAAASDVRGGSDTSKAVVSGALMGSAATYTLTDASTVAWNLANGFNATLTLGASGHTIGAPTGANDKLPISLEIVQDATGSRTVSWNAIWNFRALGVPTLSTGANKRDLLFAIYNAATSKFDVVGFSKDA